MIRNYDAWRLASPPEGPDPEEMFRRECRAAAAITRHATASENLRIDADLTVGGLEDDPEPIINWVIRLDLAGSLVKSNLVTALRRLAQQIELGS